MSEIKYYEILAIRPEYVDGTGDCTEIIYESGETYLVEKNVNSFKNNMAYHYSTDLRANRKNYGERLRIKNNVPIVLSDKHILVPYKARKPKSKTDGAYGYFDLYHLKGFEGEGNNGVIVLKNGIKLKLNQNLERYLKYIAIVERLINERR
ncbi:MAG: hypothetical protein CVU93_02170 [Firmicutes bacterium HGW-Firmicutes-18]|nr:MAG: hypothetical protein CVU93_02170 [Firmicutes bacterium HGW-Firmicutes-18]